MFNIEKRQTEVVNTSLLYKMYVHVHMYLGLQPKHA